LFLHFIKFQMAQAACLNKHTTPLPGYNAVVYTADSDIPRVFSVPRAFEWDFEKNTDVATANLALQEAFPLK
jgi:hypothetical protein